MTIDWQNDANWRGVLGWCNGIRDRMAADPGVRDLHECVKWQGHHWLDEYYEEILVDVEHSLIELTKTSARRKDAIKQGRTQILAPVNRMAIVPETNKEYIVAAGKPDLSAFAVKLLQSKDKDMSGNSSIRPSPTRPCIVVSSDAVPTREAQKRHQGNSTREHRDGHAVENILFSSPQQPSSVPPSDTLAPSKVNAKEFVVPMDTNNTTRFFAAGENDRVTGIGRTSWLVKTVSKAPAVLIAKRKSDERGDSDDEGFARARQATKVMKSEQTTSVKTEPPRDPALRKTDSHDRLAKNPGASAAAANAPAETKPQPATSSSVPDPAPFPFLPISPSQVFLRKAPVPLSVQSSQVPKVSDIFALMPANQVGGPQDTEWKSQPAPWPLVRGEARDRAKTRYRVPGGWDSEEDVEDQRVRSAMEIDEDNDTDPWARDARAQQQQQQQEHNFMAMEEPAPPQRKKGGLFLTATSMISRVLCGPASGTPPGTKMAAMPSDDAPPVPPKKQPKGMEGSPTPQPTVKLLAQPTPPPELPMPPTFAPGPAPPAVSSGMIPTKNRFAQSAARGPARTLQEQMHARVQAQVDEANGDPEDIELPEIISDYSDSEDEDRARTSDPPDWAQSPTLERLLREQQTTDPDEVFGAIREVDMEDIFKSNRTRHSKFRVRSSSANWAGADGLTAEEKEAYSVRMGYKTTATLSKQTTM